VPSRRTTAAIVLLACRGGALASRAASLGLASLWITAAALHGIGMYPVMATAVPFAALFLFTWGVLLLTDRPVPRWVLVIPLLWSIVDISAAAFLGAPQGWGLPVAAVVATLTLTARDRTRQRSSARARVRTRSAFEPALIPEHHHRAVTRPCGC
jgi:uncharacterized protein DUF6064